MKFKTYKRDEHYDNIYLYFLILGQIQILRAITTDHTVARSKAWTVFARLNTGIMGSNLTRGMDDCVRLFCLCCPV
jgi:hypothetical protein